MLTGKTLFQATNMKDLIKKVKIGQYSIPRNLELSNELIDFLDCMLQDDESLRWSAERLAEHPFLTKDVNEFEKIPKFVITKNTKYNLNIPLYKDKILFWIMK